MLNISKNNIDDRLAEKQLYSLKTLKTPQLGIYIARVLIVISAITFISLFMPWQQNIHGNGQLTALSPSDRPHTVQSVIQGQIKEWFVSEGDLVDKGDTLVELGETKDKYFDPNLLQRLSNQITAKEASLEAKKLKREAYKNQIAALRQALIAKINQQNNKVAQSNLKVVSDSIALEAEKINYANQQNIFERNKERYERGNISLTKYQELETKFNLSKAKLVEKSNKLDQSRAELSIAITELSGVQAEYSEKISKATTDLQATLSEINETEAEIVKLENEYANVEIRRENYILRAPQKGYVVQAQKVGIGESIKEGDPVVTIMPFSPQLAVEMYVKAMDVPLIEPGRKVRIEFDGWPALQFSGWPSVSVGTFGGIVKVIDKVSNGKNGRFRILVVPDPEDEPWPKQLRLGSGTKGWVMLENVRIWYEIWRQLNGFPPSLYEEPQDEPKEKPKNKIKIK